MGNNIVLKLADFSKFPSGRDEHDGKFNGKKYRESILAPAVKDALERHQRLEVSLAGVLNFGSSFFEEAFGGLVRKNIANKEQLKRILIISPEDSYYGKYKTVIFKHIRGARPE